MIEIVAILVSLIWGSFTNALIYRLPLRISLLNPKRSHCPGCKADIRWYDNIPILSWLILKGKCRSCSTQISVVYPLVEALNVLFAIISIHYFGLNPTGILAFFLLSILLVITIIDLRYMIIPDRINKPGMIIGLLLGLINQFFTLFAYPFSPSIIDSAIGLVCGYGVLFIIAWTYFKISGVSGLGGGDIKLMGFIGALLGPFSVIPILITASFAGSIIGVLIIAFKRSGIRTEIPFGPWLALGIALYVFGFDAMAIIQASTSHFLIPS